MSDWDRLVWDVLVASQAASEKLMREVLDDEPGSDAFVAKWGEANSPARVAAIGARRGQLWREELDKAGLDLVRVRPVDGLPEPEGW